MNYQQSPGDDREKERPTVSTNYPQGPQGQPTNPFVQPQPPKKKHTLRNLLIGGGVLMALVVGGCSAALAGGASDTTGAAETKPSAAAPAEVEKPAEKQAEEPKAEKAEPKEEKESKPKVVKVSAGKLIKAFEDNELKADAKYKGKTLQVTGVVDEVDTELFDEDKYILSVDDGDEWEFLSVRLLRHPRRLRCPDLDTGDKVTVVGEFSDGGDLGVTVRNAHLEN